MIIDMHYHLDERMMTIETLLRKMDEARIDRVALMAQVTDPIPEPGEPLIIFGQFLLKHRLTRNIAKSLVSNFTEEGDIKLPAGIFRIYPEPDNGIVFSAAENYPEKFFGWIFVNPAGSADPADEYKRWRNSKGFIGVKSHPFWHRYNPAELLPVAGLAAEDGKPLLMHAGFGGRGDYSTLRKEIPELKIILAHAGFPQFSDSWRMIKSDKRILVDFSSNHYVSYNTIKEAVEYLGADRCLFGTDGPFGRPGSDGTMDYGFIKRRIESLFPDKGIQKRILGDNFAELVGVSL